MDNFPLAYNLADALASYVLADVKDKQGAPLILHCRRVAAKCQERGLTHEQIIAALLHEVLEDVSYPVPYVERYRAIESLFGSEVSPLVVALTRIPGKVYSEYIGDIICVCPRAVPIKIVDLDDNLDPSRGPIPDSLLQRYLWARSRLQKSTVVSKVTITGSIPFRIHLGVPNVIS